METEVTEAMVLAALNAWYQIDHKWKGDSSLKRDMRRAIEAALEAAPSGHGERG